MTFLKCSLMLSIIVLWVFFWNVNLSTVYLLVPQLKWYPNLQQTADVDECYCQYLSQESEAEPVAGLRQSWDACASTLGPVWYGKAHRCSRTTETSASAVPPARAALFNKTRELPLVQNTNILPANPVNMAKMLKKQPVM